MNLFQKLAYTFLEQNWLAVLFLGLLLILSGVIIILVPEILIALIAGTLIFVGLIIAILGWNLRALEKKQKRIEIYID